MPAEPTPAPPQELRSSTSAKPIASPVAPLPPALKTQSVAKLVIYAG
jgi:hypothetical protein